MALAMPLLLAGCDGDDGGTSAGGTETDGNTSTTSTSGPTTTTTTTSTTTATTGMTSTTTDTEGDTDTTTDTETTGAVCPDTPATFQSSRAIRYGDIDFGGGGTDGGSTTTTDGMPPDPDSLSISLTSIDLTCVTPDPLLPCGGNWEVSVLLPPDMQTPGAYDLAAVNGFFTETGPAAVDCSFGGGTLDGTLEIISISDQEVEARLCNVSVIGGSFDPNGAFTAPRCPSGG